MECSRQQQLTLEILSHPLEMPCSPLAGGRPSAQAETRPYRRARPSCPLTPPHASPWLDCLHKRQSGTLSARWDPPKPPSPARLQNLKKPPRPILPSFSLLATLSEFDSSIVRYPRTLVNHLFRHMLDLHKYTTLKGWEVPLDGSSVAPPGSHWSNKDMDPVPPEGRVWTWFSYVTMYVHRS